MRELIDGGTLLLLRTVFVRLKRSKEQPTQAYTGGIKSLNNHDVGPIGGSNPP